MGQDFIIRFEMKIENRELTILGRERQPQNQSREIVQKP